MLLRLLLLQRVSHKPSLNTTTPRTQHGLSVPKIIMHFNAKMKLTRSPEHRQHQQQQREKGKRRKCTQYALVLTRALQADAMARGVDQRRLALGKACNAAC